MREIEREAVALRYGYRNAASVRTVGWPERTIGRCFARGDASLLVTIFPRPASSAGPPECGVPSELGRITPNRLNTVIAELFVRCGRGRLDNGFWWAGAATLVIRLAGLG